MLNTNTLFDIIFSEINLFYAHAAGVGTGIVMAITKLYAGRRDEFSKAYGTILLSVSIFLMTNNKVIFPQETDPRLTKDPMFLGAYFGLVLYASAAVLICIMFILDGLENPWYYCKRLTAIIPITMVGVFFLSGTIYICLCDSATILITLYASGWAIFKIHSSKKANVFFNFPFITLVITSSLILDLVGTLTSSTKMLMFSELIPGFMIAYITLIERFFPVLFSKAYGDNKAPADNQAFSDFPMDNNLIESEEDQAESTRNILEGVELDKIEERINSFLQVRGYADEELRLPDFASYLGLSTHQASYYLNKHMSMKFADFLNMNRIEDVKRNLRDKSHMNLLQVALECGFNSASSFHRACVKFTGKSPREFRKQLINSQN
ncbi:helix-turn-helix domain-containing protein [Leptospira mayottensis]|uniref:DNA-binding helix-turn-helix protein n=2 Tax=Leptospira mayottensis TaxID=1137606 RepID=A0AA87MN97_9LEPT|nr:helix-turn-helix domain-containing protein [Leptospira mayottensis]AXR62601.1 AraC family transcriptional regulator [Leptospira mayottensis]AXR66503.1 AraC family transcriptional regulator [Leptospira mayottensis]AZQ03984.1 AraC family transcriptional regulator [Leptospira mayottensis 200901116]EKR98812.1 DNA-binding helix-turn-helix protein [Leptospira mayottensis 200901122]TGM99940.1 AraC family transcriptional regulator [Leptospira mayottensis]